MTMMSCCLPSRDRCFYVFPCLSDPVRKSALCLRLALVMLHLLFVGLLFIFNQDFRDKFKTQPLYTSIYLLLVVATLVQYFFTSGSTPGYVIDAMREFAKTEASLRASEISKQPASSKNGSVVVTIDKNRSGDNIVGNNPMNWTKLVMDMYPSGTSVRTYTCSYCNVVQPPNQNIVMIVTDVFFSLITIVFGSERVLARATIVDFGGTFLRKQPYLFGLAFCILSIYKLHLKKHGWWMLS